MSSLKHKATNCGEHQQPLSAAMVKLIVLISCLLSIALASVECSGLPPSSLLGNSNNHRRQLQQQQQSQQEMLPFQDWSSSLSSQSQSLLPMFAPDLSYDYQRANTEQSSRDFARALIQLVMARPMSSTGSGGDERLYLNSIDPIDTKRSYYKPCSVNPVSCFGRRRRR